MTLNISLVAPWASYQSSDFRLSRRCAGGGYEALDVLGHKQVTVMGKGWHASVAFTGVAKVGRIDVDQWLAEQVTALGNFGEFDGLIEALRGADDWLQRIAAEHRRHTFTVVAYLGRQVEAVIISTFQNGRGVASHVGGRMDVHRYRPTQAQVFVTGMEDAVARADTKLLRNMLRARKPLQDVIEALARVNARSADRPAAANTISSACHVTSLRPNGRTASRTFGLDPAQEYSPPAEAIRHEAFDMEAVFREAGFTGPPRLLGTLTVGSWGTDEADPDEHIDFTRD